ncbi:DUF1672 family protein [Staphylococcus simulans]|uniref:DUF1672 domain-containing protein n=1 Tax=Staphylococcus simulans TaxID=1286 RepID=A0A6N2YX57_STASI|nr:DUF1672 domain-containing protein [Staphylococcus sp. CWZ226]
MKKICSTIIISTLLLGGCHNLNNSFTNKVPDTMPVNEYKGQGFQPHAEKKVIELAKKHYNEYAELGERFFQDNFGLKVKATNVVGSGDGVEVFVHCDDHDIVFNSSIVLTSDSLGHKGSMRAKGESDELSTQIGKVVSGFDYKANKKEYDELYQYFKDNQKKYSYYGFTKEAINKTQNSGYQNEFFWISGYPIDLAQYDKYYKPLIQMNQKEFSEKYYQARYNATGGVTKTHVITTFFDTNSNYNKDKEDYKLLDLADAIQKNQLGPDKSEVKYTLTYTSNEITTYDGTKNGNNEMSYGVYNSEQ